MAIAVAPAAHIEHESPRERRRRLGYGSYQAMHSRCLHASHMYFRNYGGRGITICARWRGRGGFDRFIEDLGPRPSLKHELDRIDSNGNYEPGNVRWATRQQNQRNRRNTVRAADGRSVLDLIEERLGAVPKYVLTRVGTLGWDPDRAISERKRAPGTRWRRLWWERGGSLYDPSWDEYVAADVLSDLIEAFGPPVELERMPESLSMDEASMWMDGLFGFAGDCPESDALDIDVDPSG